MIRRFYDLLATDSGTVNVAELMAKHGVKTDETSSVAIPSIDTATEVPPAPAREVEIKGTETVTNDSAPEATRPAEQPTPIPEPVKPASVAEQPRPVEPDWREVLKKQPEVEVYKHLGLDEKMINFLSRWKGGEDLKDYLEAVTVDYAKLSPEDVMRRHLQKEYGALAPEDFEELYRMKVTEQYKLDADVFDEKEMRRGRLLLGVDADKIRQDFMKRQQELIFSKPEAPGRPEAELELERMQAEREQSVANYKAMVEQDAYTKEVLNNKLLKIGDGEKAFNLEVTNPQNLLDVLYDPAKWAAKIFNQDGTPNVRKQMLIAAIVDDDTLFMNNMSKHFEMLGAKKAIEPIENASPPIGTPSKGDESPQDPAAALARGGVITSGW